MLPGRRSEGLELLGLIRRRNERAEVDVDARAAACGRLARDVVGVGVLCLAVGARTVVEEDEEGVRVARVE